MNLLAVDTSSALCSTAVLTPAGVFAVDAHAPNAHSDRLIADIESCLQRAGISRGELNAISFGQGPGSFTGIRIGCGVAQGIALGLSVPLLGICSLLAMAEHAGSVHGASRIATSLNARLGEFYFAAYESVGDNKWRTMIEPCLATRKSMPQLQGEWLLAGDGFGADALSARDLGLSEARIDVDIQTHAAAIARIASARLAAGYQPTRDDALPLYVRHKVAQTIEERQRGEVHAA